MSTLTQVDFTEEDFKTAKKLAVDLGFGERTAYTSSSALIGLFCLPSRTDSREGCIVKTKELGFLFVRVLEE